MATKIWKYFLISKLANDIINRGDEFDDRRKSSHSQVSFRRGRTCHELCHLENYEESAIGRMDKLTQTVRLPVPVYQFNLVVFPAPTCQQDNSRFLVLQIQQDINERQIGYLELEYIPGMVYCFLPSMEKYQGSVSLYTSKPGFLGSYSVCFEVNVKSLVFSYCKQETKLEKSVTKCDGCFLNHFPSPNSLKCKLKRDRNTQKSTQRRLIGGATRVSGRKMIIKAIAEAEKHGIKVHNTTPNSADGNCIFESVIDSINRRSCFQQSLPELPDHYRKRWLEEVESIGYDKWNCGKTIAEWKEEWSILKSSKTYEYDLGDLILPGVAHCIQKDILVFNISSMAGNSVFVIESSSFADRASDTEVPICLAYDLYHYEALFPNTEEDVIKTIKLKQDVIAGKYEANAFRAISNLSIQEQCYEKTDNNDALNEKKLEQLKKIKKKDRTVEQNKLYTSLMRLKRKEKDKKRKAAVWANYTVGERNKIYENRRKRTDNLQQTEKNRLRKALFRGKQTAEKKNEENQMRKVRDGKIRKNYTQEKRTILNEKKRKLMTETRESYTLEKKKAENETQKRRRRTLRMEQSIEKQIEVKERDKIAKARNRTGVDYKEGLNSKIILQGIHKVLDLQESKDNIGQMDNICQYCGALKFRKETSSTCCSNGKVVLENFPRPPKELDNLWHADTVEGRLLRENARSINNAVCLTSIKVKTKDFGKGYSPNIIFEGKVTQLAGPLKANDGDQPYFAQLYLHDPQLESSQRFKNMTIPANMSKSQKKIMEQLLLKIQSILHKHNPFVKDFKQVLDIPSDDLLLGKLVITAKARPQGEHQRRYNEQLNLQEVSILKSSEPHDLVLHLRGGSLQDISDLNPKGMPLHFTLLFPYGTYGWDPDTKHADGKRRVTTREFYVYHINQRCSESDYLHVSGRLFQEWCCMGWVAVENQKLMFQRMNQKALRADTYKNVQEITDRKKLELAPRSDGMFSDDCKQPAVGRKILSSSMVGSPRWYNSKFQDGMAIVREYHKPDFFITMTCNPRWPEIVNGLKKCQSPQDRPDLVARVFKLKKDQLMQDLKSGHVLGRVVAHMNVIEFQKRGLPHVHILLILADCDRIMSPEFVDSAVCAELPPGPDSTSTECETNQRSRLQKIVLTNMIHGPCGKENPSSPCMENGRCTKRFPKEFQKHTSVDQDNNYATYRRRAPKDGGQEFVCPKTKTVIDNRWVVPYNPFLSLRYNCHINVEFCTSPKAAKYLYKYVTKGHDRAMISTVLADNGKVECRDEIKEYEDLRSIGSSEATWHLMAFPIADRQPPVQALRIHLEDQQQVVFDEGTEEEALENQRETELTAFFKLNQALQLYDKDSGLSYVDLPKKFRYDKASKQWIRRKPQSENTVIGRVHTIHPIAGDVFYLRILLHNQFSKGKTSFANLKTLPNGKVCESYKEVCRELGLLKDDMEWKQVLEESGGTKLPKQARELFIVILIFCQPSNPRELLDKFWMTWIDDFELQGRQCNVLLDKQQLKTMVLLDLEMRLQSFEKELEDFGLPKPTPEELNQIKAVSNTEPVLIREEKDYSIDKLEEFVKVSESKFTSEQLVIYEAVMEAVRQGRQLLAFIDARGGCGKTFLLNAILASVRSSEPGGCVALAMATTGIAANLLSLGRTFHSRMKAPLAANEQSLLQISAQSSLSKLIKMAKLLLIDESTMLDRYQLEAMDRSLRDIMGVENVPFGGKIVILAGDFRQCLPVVPGANRAGTIGQCINKSHLWKQFSIHRLTNNLRVSASGDPRKEEFDKWTLSIGNGISQDGRIYIPNSMCTQIIPNSKDSPKNEENCMKKFCAKIFPDLMTNLKINGWLEGRAILAPTNKEVDALNDIIQEWITDRGIMLPSADTLENPNDVFRFNTEYLNTLTPSGFPKHLLHLKPGMPLMILRNINPRQGLCNGTRVIFDKCINNKLLQCRIVETNEVVLIPRITFIPKVNKFPFEWQRRQFPVRPSFAMTINKAQGQTLRFAGIWLRVDVFTHGQLYVACSRVGDPDNLHLAIIQDSSENSFSVVNVVYDEVLLENNT